MEYRRMRIAGEPERVLHHEVIGLLIENLECPTVLPGLLRTPIDLVAARFRRGRGAGHRRKIASGAASSASLMNGLVGVHKEASRGSRIADVFCQYQG
jgi:hypothetical protein